VHTDTQTHTHTLPRNITFSLFRGEDDINDVTFMAEVNLDEENACILAAHSDFVGTLIQSCKEEPFLVIGALQKRILDIGKCRIMILDPVGMLVEEKYYLKRWPGTLKLT
jgi:hypothetical protein